MKKKSNEQPLKEAIDQYLKAFKLDRRLLETEVKTGWEKMMGPTIARYTGEIAIKDEVMYVQLRSAALRHELNMSKEQIIENINREAGQPVINNIVFR